MIINSQYKRLTPFNFLLLTVILTVLLFSACSKKEEKFEKKEPSIKVYTSIFPLEYFTKSLLPDAKVESLIASGVDPHHFEPSVKDIQRLFDAKLVIYLGDTDVDRWIDKIRSEITHKGVKVLRLQDFISFKSYEFSKELDPHIWLDPLLSLEILRNIKKAISEIAVEKKGEIEKNFDTLEKKLIELDRLYRETLSNCGLRTTISTHEFLNYLGSRYGFKTRFIVHEPDHEPSLRKIKELKDFMRKNSIEYIISEPEGDKIANMLSKETGAKILKFNTFHIKTEKDYYSIMRENLMELEKALKCKIK